MKHIPLFRTSGGRPLRGRIHSYKLMKAIVFTRHELTAAQIAGIRNSEFEPVYLTELASENVQTLDRALEIARILVAQFPEQGILDIYGVFPAPLRWALDQILGSGMAESDRVVFLHESFNVNRAPEGASPEFTTEGASPEFTTEGASPEFTTEGEKPKFEHAGWLLTQTFNE